MTQWNPQKVIKICRNNAVLSKSYNKYENVEFSVF